MYLVGNTTVHDCSDLAAKSFHLHVGLHKEEQLSSSYDKMPHYNGCI